MRRKHYEEYTLVSKKNSLKEAKRALGARQPKRLVWLPNTHEINTQCTIHIAKIQEKPGRLTILNKTQHFI
ncbi:hypothetical protein OMAG_002573 [Candidatus Omnitrophus magneticus]|uniref:Uncharacterized protein n=1 Tax=Candidatus Omnitrophus magneticus TaxID=1609969 RepID=A0A0F0CNH4_9BACT|nr:hypothetical protein OMAG_002573 [Candidatus Omnitrophus magneticus]